MIAADIRTERVISRHLDSIDWEHSEYTHLAERIKDKCISVLRGNLPVRLFLERAAEKDPYAVFLALTYHGRWIRLSAEERKQLELYITQRMENAVGEIDESLESGLFRLVCPMAFALHTQSSELYGRILTKLKRLDVFEELAGAAQTGENISDSELLDFFAQIFSVLRDSPRAFLMTARCCSMLYDELGMNLLKAIVLKLGTSKYRIEVMIEDNTADLQRLLDQALNENDMAMLFSLERIFRNLNLLHIGITEDELIRRVFDQTKREDFRNSLSFAENMLYKRYEDPIDSIRHLETLLDRHEKKDNPLWYRYSRWYRVYLLSLKVRYDTENAKMYIESFSEDDGEPAENLSYTRTVSSIVQGAVESLIREQNPLLMEYLRAIQSVNVYSETVIRNSIYCNVLECRISYADMVSLLRNMNYSRSDIIYIYMNTHFRRLLRWEQFLRELDQQFERDGSIVANLRRAFISYQFGAFYDREKMQFSIKGLYTGPMKLSARWTKNHPNYFREVLDRADKEQEIIVSLGECDAYQYRCSVFPVVSRQEAEHYDDSRERLNTLFAYLQQVEQTGMLTTEMNIQISGLPRVQLAEIEEKRWNDLNDLDIRLSVQYLKCCASIAEKTSGISADGSGSVRYFVNMFTRNDFCVRNKYRYSGKLDSCKVTRYSSEVFREVIGCWNRLKASACTFEDVFFVYMNTILKHCVTLSSVMHTYCPKGQRRVDFRGMLGEYSGYWFGGDVLKRDIEEGQIFVKPWDISNYSGRFGYDTYLYQEQTSEQTNYVRGKCRFTIKSYDYVTRTFYLENLRSQEENEYLPGNQFLTVLRELAVRKQMRTSDILTICAEDSTFADRLKAAMVDPLLSALVLRLDDAAALEEYLTVIQNKNPWRFDCREMERPRLQGTQRYELVGRAMYLLKGLALRGDMYRLAELYFNSPLRLLIPFTRMIKMCLEWECDRSQLLEELGRYPLVNRDGRWMNIEMEDAVDNREDGTYMVTCWSAENGPVLSLWCGRTMPPDIAAGDVNDVLRRITDRRWEKLRKTLTHIIKEGVISGEDHVSLQDNFGVDGLNDTQVVELHLDILEICVVLAENGISTESFTRTVNSCYIENDGISLGAAVSEIGQKGDILSPGQRRRLGRLGERFEHCMILENERNYILTRTILRLI